VTSRSGTSSVFAIPSSVSPDLILNAWEAGYSNLTADDLVKLHDHGVDGPYIRRLYAGGLKNLSVEQLVKLHDHGVD